MKHVKIQKLFVTILSVLAILSLLTVACVATDLPADTQPELTTEAPAETTPDAAPETAPESNKASTFSAFLLALFSGTNLALLGAALAVVLPCIGSAKGVAIVSQAATGLLSEQPHLFGKCFPLMALPMTQGVYGLVASFLILMKIGLFGNTEYLTNMGVLEGGFYLMAALPIAIAGLISAIHQGRTAATGVNLVGKRPGSMGHGITAAALVETYAIFALLITLLLVMRSPFAA